MSLFERVRTMAYAETSSAHDDSFSGIVIFCGISLLLWVVALASASSGGPPAAMF